MMDTLEDYLRMLMRFAYGKFHIDRSFSFVSIHERALEYARGRAEDVVTDAAPEVRDEVYAQEFTNQWSLYLLLRATEQDEDFMRDLIAASARLRMIGREERRQLVAVAKNAVPLTTNDILTSRSVNQRPWI